MSRVEKPGAQRIWSNVSASTGSSTEQTRLARARHDLHRVHAAAVIGNFEHHHVAHARGAQTDDGALRLASGGALGRRFNAVTDRIPHQVKNRIEHALDEELVDLGILAAHLEFDVLARLSRQIAHHERHAAKNLSHRDEPDAHDAFAQIAQVSFDDERRFLDRAPFDGRDARLDAREGIAKARARDDEIADHAHQIVEASEVHANVMRRREQCGLGGGLRRRRGDTGLRRGENRCERDALLGPRGFVGWIEAALDLELESNTSVGANARHGVDDFAGLAQESANTVDTDPARRQLTGRRKDHAPALSCGVSVGGRTQRHAGGGGNFG